MSISAEVHHAKGEQHRVIGRGGISCYSQGLAAECKTRRDSQGRPLPGLFGSTAALPLLMGGASACGHRLRSAQAPPTQ